MSAAYKKLVISGNVVELYEYEKQPYQITGEREYTDHDVEDWILEDAKRVQEQLDNMGILKRWAIEMITGRLASNITRSRNMVRRLILSNFSNESRFVTFTFDDKKVTPEENTDINAANRRFKTFIQRMRRKYGRFKYLTVIEFQERGAVHYHCLTDWPYIKADKLAEIWGNGFIKVNKIRHVDNVGAYVVKYMTKDLTDMRLFGNKAYQCSKGLERPTVVRGDLAEELIKMYGLTERVEVFANSYESEYLGQVTYREFNLSRIIPQKGIGANENTRSLSFA